MQNWAHFLAVSAAFLSIAVIVSLATWSHATSAAAIYSAVQKAHHDGSDPAAFFEIVFTDAIPAANSGLILGLGREGARWAHNVHNEATIWAFVILAILIFTLGYHFWQSR